MWQWESESKSECKREWSICDVLVYCPNAWVIQHGQGKSRSPDPIGLSRGGQGPKLFRCHLLPPRVNLTWKLESEAEPVSACIECGCATGSSVSAPDALLIPCTLTRKPDYAAFYLLLLFTYVDTVKGMGHYYLCSFAFSNLLEQCLVHDEANAYLFLQVNTDRESDLLLRN